MTRPPLKKAIFTKEYSDWLSAMLKWVETGCNGKRPVPNKTSSIGVN